MPKTLVEKSGYVAHLEIIDTENVRVRIVEGEMRMAPKKSGDPASAPLPLLGGGEMYSQVVPNAEAPKLGTKAKMVVTLEG